MSEVKQQRPEEEAPADADGGAERRRSKTMSRKEMARDLRGAV